MCLGRSFLASPFLLGANMNVTDEIREDSIVLGDELEGQQFAVKSDAAFFDVLSNSLYSMPKIAVIRETITNAVDAHKEAGINEPVEVQYNYRDNLLIVSDKGHGIPHDKIHEIYCTYGNSFRILYEEKSVLYVFVVLNQHM